MSSQSYEEICRIVETLERSADADSRDVKWLTSEQLLGMSRNHLGQLEIFIVSDRLSPNLRIVRDNLEYEDWHRNNGIDFSANRLLFPAANHFDSVVAFLCVELLKQGVLIDPHSSFRLQEPVIALALERHAMADTSLVGLLGELLVLYWLMKLTSDDLKIEVLNSWAGFERSARDFQVRSVGIEVKTTRGLRSTHHVSGIHQVEIQQTTAEFLEKNLFLVSIGCSAVKDESESAINIPILMDAILELIDEVKNNDVEIVKKSFIERVSHYGIGNEIGYDHSSMSSRERFRRKWSINFVRGYDMSDDSIKVITQDVLFPLSNVVGTSVEFSIDLPDVIRGDLNPTVGMQQTINRIVQSAEII